MKEEKARFIPNLRWNYFHGLTKKTKMKLMFEIHLLKKKPKYEFFQALKCPLFPENICCKLQSLLVSNLLLDLKIRICGQDKQ